jgi:hypothetical protein
MEHQQDFLLMARRTHKSADEQPAAATLTCASVQEDETTNIVT